MNIRIKKVNFILSIISLLIIIFVLNFNAYAEDDENVVVYNFTRFYEYTGNDIFLSDLELKYNGEPLTLDVDYEISYNEQDYSSIGTKNAILTLIGDNGYYFSDSETTQTITYYVVDKIINLSDFDIYDGMNIEMNEGTASVEDLTNNLLSQYSDYINITGTTSTTEVGENEFYINFNNLSSKVVILYGDNSYKETSEDPLRIIWNSLKGILENDDPDLEISNNENVGYNINQELTYDGNPYLRYKGIEITEDNYDTVTVVKDSNGNIHMNGSETGISDTDADGSIYTAYVTVTFKNEYYGTINYEVTIGPSIASAELSPLDDARLDGISLYYEYNGEIIIPSFDLILNINDVEKTLKLDEDFIITNKDEITKDVCENFDLYVEGIGNYGGSLTLFYNVEAINSDDLTINDIPEYVIYNNEEVTLNPTIIDKYNNTLIKDTDYEISYENNNEIGTASYRIDFIGNYEGSIEGTFRIVETLITEDDSNLRVEGLHDSDYYLGQQATINASLLIYYNDVLLTSDDYDIETIIKDNDGNVHHNNSGGSGINDEDADGTVYKAYATITFKGQYAGELNYTFDVKPSIETATINVLDDARLDGNTLYYEYNGEEIIPSFNLILGDFTLTYGTDFELSDRYEFNNINKGTYEKLLKGIGNYGGTFYLYIEIEGKDIDSNDIQMEYESNCYVPIDSNNFLFNITIHDEALNYDLIKSDDFDLNFYLNVDTVTITISGLNNYGGSKEITVNRANLLLENDLVNITYDTTYNDYNAMYYTGNANHPTVVVSINDEVLIENTDYEISYDGDYSFGSKITLTIKGLSFIYGELNYEYIIYSPTFEDIEYTYVGNKNLEYILLRTEKADLIELYTNIDISDVGAYSTTATLKPGYVFKDGDNYSLEGTININIIPQEVSNDFDISYDELIYNGKELTPSLKIIDFEENELILNQDYKLSYTNNVEVGSMLLKIEGIGNYNGVLEDYPIEILPRSLNGDYIKYETSKNLYHNELDDNYIYYINIYDEEMNYKLVQDVDYNIYSSFDGDKGYINVEGINNYKEFLEIEVPLAKYLIDENNINIEFDSNDESNNIMYFTGLEALPNIEIKYDDNVLIEGTDYIVNYEGNFSEYGSLINVNISGLNDYYISYDSSFILKSTIVNEISLQYRGKTTISNLISLSEYKDIFESFDDFEIDFIGAYELSAKVKKGYVIANDNYSLEGIINVLVYTEDAELEIILEEAAEDIIQTATMSSEFDLDSINFEDLTGLSKEELIKAKEYYNDLEKYVIDNEIDVLVNNHLKELGYDVLVSAEEIAVRLKIYLDSYAINVGYTDFNAQVDDAINAMTVEEEKDIVKEELDAFIHRHTKASTMEKLHKVVEEKNEELDSVYYSKYTDDSTRSDYFNELTEKVHEIKNVTIIIVKHTQNQEIANNNIESYYNELVESGKYNEAQLQLLKEVFDEMQQRVEAVLSADNIDDQLAVQDELDKIVNDAILKLTNVEITSIKIDDEKGVKASIDASEGMNSKTELNVENADKNVSIKINKAINSNNVKGSDDAILLIKNKDVKEAYNINLMVEGEALEEFKGVYTVKLLLTDELKSYNNLQIIYIASDGSIEVCNTYIDGDYLVFNTTHFSTYYLLGDKLIDFAPYIKIFLALIAALIIFIVYLVLKIKNKKINQIGLSLSICLLPVSAFININVFVVCIILGIIALILLITAILLVIKDYRKDRSLENEE